MTIARVVILSLALTFAVRAEQWSSTLSNCSPQLTIVAPADTNSALPVIIWLENLAGPPRRTESDAKTLSAFTNEGYLVLRVDYARHPQARVPFLNRDLGKMRDDLRAKTLLAGFKLDDAHIFMVPEGCRLQRDLVFYREEKRTLSLDLIYPAAPKRPVGAIIEFSCDNQSRFGNTSLSICSDTILDAFATEGFAVAMADHPVAAPYKGLDPMPDCARKIKAAVRTLRAQGRTLGLNGKIAPVGFSRGSGMALMLVTTGTLPEFDGFGESTNASSTVQGAVVMSGRFTYLDLLPDDKMIPRYAKVWGERNASMETWRRHGALDYLTGATTPLFLTINSTEAPEALHQMEVLRRRLTELGSPFEFHLEAAPRGHKVTLDPKILAEMSRYFHSRLD